MSESRRTPLYARHVELGARMVDFAGFTMPVQYESIKSEHRAVREGAGLFDVSHMGQIHLSGKTALESAERLLTCRVDSLEVGQVRYGLLCNGDGGCVDDVTVYREGPNAFMLCVNASNIDKDRNWILEGALAGSEIQDRSDETGLLAIQGPKSAELLDRLCPADDPGPSSLGRFRFSTYSSPVGPLLISRTGYTGSDGFEIYLPADASLPLFDLLLETGEGKGLAPAGLGARDTLRLEAALPLYGHELDDTTSPLEAGLGRFVKRKRGGFIGHEAIEERERQGRSRQLVGFELLERGVARAGYPIFSEGDEIGLVTSGAPSPSLGTSIGLGYVPPDKADPGTELAIAVRQKNLGARVVTTPFRSNS